MFTAYSDFFVKHDHGKFITVHKNYYSTLRQPNGAWFGMRMLVRPLLV